MTTPIHFMTPHITDERLRGFIDGWTELTREEQEHIRNCRNCKDRLRIILTSNGEAKAS